MSPGPASHDAQDIGDGTGGGHVAMTKVEQPATELAPTPVGMVTTQGDDPLRDHHIGALRAMMRAPGTLLQAARALALVAMQPLVTGLRTDPKAPAQLATVASFQPRLT